MFLTVWFLFSYGFVLLLLLLNRDWMDEDLAYFCYCRCGSIYGVVVVKVNFVVVMVVVVEKVDFVMVTSIVVVVVKVVVVFPN